MLENVFSWFRFLVNLVDESKHSRANDEKFQRQLDEYGVLL